MLNDSNTILENPEFQLSNAQWVNWFFWFFIRWRDTARFIEIPLLWEPIDKLIVL